MRVIGGELGGRRINPPGKMPFTRPTTDIAKEGLFNILQNQIDFTDLKTLDLFGGTGSISYEFASRGATHITIVEKDPTMFTFIKKTVEQFKIEGAEVVKMDVFKWLNACTERFDLIFAGPPYALTEIDDLPGVIFERKILNKEGLFILEHTPRNSYTSFPYFKSERNYGTTIFSIFEESRD